MWAEERGNFGRGAFEWIFGNGSDGRQHSMSGYTMMAPGRILRTGLASDPRHELLKVALTINGRVSRASIEKPVGQHSVEAAFEDSVRYPEGDCINFKTIQRTDNTPGCGVVTV